MADQPSDTPASDVSDGGGAGGPAPAQSEAAEAAAAAKASNPHRTKQIVAGAALGIGSAALVAALLYASRSKKGDKRGD